MNLTISSIGEESRARKQAAVFIQNGILESQGDKSAFFEAGRRFVC